MPVDHLAHLNADLDRVSRVLEAGPDLDARVAACPDWTLRALVLHLGGVHGWATSVVLTGDRSRPEVQPVSDGELAGWFAAGGRAMLAALAVDPRQPCWGFGPQQDVGFWQRRQAHETAVHRIDAERCVGDAGPLDDSLAEDGIAEVLEVMHPRQVALGRTEPPTRSVELVSTTGGRWQLGAGPSVGTVTGPACELLLLLWARAPRTSSALQVVGDPEALDALLGGHVTP
ncbi:maleylpyruvate isomerase family mycothiol-dependent enzyme [soil metagenome]